MAKRWIIVILVAGVALWFFTCSRTPKQDPNTQIYEVPADGSGSSRRKIPRQDGISQPPPPVQPSGPGAPGS